MLLQQYFPKTPRRKYSATHSCSSHSTAPKRFLEQAVTLSYPYHQVSRTLRPLHPDTHASQPSGNTNLGQCNKIQLLRFLKTPHLPLCSLHGVRSLRTRPSFTFRSRQPVPELARSITSYLSTELCQSIKSQFPSLRTLSQQPS